MTIADDESALCSRCRHPRGLHDVDRPGFCDFGFCVCKRFQPMSSELSQAKQCWSCKAVAHNNLKNCFACGRAYADAPVPEPAEVGLDLHMLRHNVIEAAKAYYRDSSGVGPEQGLIRSVMRLIAGEEEHTKTVTASPSGAPQRDWRYHTSECQWTRAQCEYKDTHEYCPHLEHACSCGKVSDRDDPLAYEKQRCAEIAAQLRDAHENITVQDDESKAFAKMLWDAAYWLDRMANR